MAISAAAIPEHPVASKLRTQVLPWVVSGKLLPKQWFCRLHLLFGYTTDVTVALGALGLSIPLVTALVADADDKKAKMDIARLLPHEQRWLYYVALASVVLWVCLRVAYAREGGQKRAVLARSCSQTMRQAEARLFTILANGNPIPELNKLVAETIAPSVDRNIQEEAWPWSGWAPEIDKHVDLAVGRLSLQFSSSWNPVTTTGPVPEQKV
ncbi:MAG: hypothetical protein JWM95_391 [Gemmatimonadetes bacterium]|nr:hypothetical protein [Gemmatimonadota bacterium]